MANKPNNPALWSKAKSLAKQKFDVYPCVPMDSQALTKNGWKYYDQLSIGELILTYNQETGYTEWSPIKALQFFEKAPLVKLYKSQTNCKVRCTPNHKWVLAEPNSKYPNNLVEAQHVTKHMKLKIAAQIAPDQQQEVDLKKFSKTDSWVDNVLQMSLPQLQSFFASGIVYDGNDKGLSSKGDKQTFGFSQKNQDHGEAMEIAAVLLGYRVCSIQKKDNPTMRSWTFISRDYESTQNLNKEDIEPADVWCPTTDNQTWIMKQDGYVTITGNSAYANGWAAKWYKSKGGTWSKAEYGMEIMNDGGEPDNPGFNALPEYVQQKIMSNMAFGGYTQPPMFMQTGGEPDGAMALGQIEAAIDKLQTLKKFIQPDSDLEPWVSSKLTMMDHYTDAVSDYMQYNPEAQMMQQQSGLPMEQMAEGGIPERYKNMGFTKVGAKKNSTRPGKKWMVLAKKGDDYKVVHGGYDGMKDFSQHGSEKRKERFWDRMGGKNSAKAKDPFSPLYWHKRFGTWAEGGEIQTYQEGGERGFLETVSQFLPGYETYLDLRDIVQGAFKGDRAQMNQGVIGLGQPFSGKALTGSLDYITEKLTSKQKADYISSKRSNILDMSEREKVKLFERYGKDGYDKWVKEGKPKLKKGGSTFSGNAWYEMGGGYIPEFIGGMLYENGGININPKNRGKFTASAQRAGMSVQEFANHVLTNKEDYSPLQVKRANFARNAAKWKKDEGGIVEGSIMDVTPEQLEILKAQGYEFEII